MFRDFKKYEVFDDGRIWSYSRNRFLKPTKNRGGYCRLQLSDNDGKTKDYLVHRVVYQSIHGEIPEGYEINHLDENPSNNVISNLSVCSHLENIRYGSRSAKASEKQRNDPNKSKRVAAYRDGVLVMTFPSTREAQRQGYNKGNVSACARGKLKSYKNYQWLYFEDSPPLFYMAS